MWLMGKMALGVYLGVRTLSEQMTIKRVKKSGFLLTFDPNKF